MCSQALGAGRGRTWLFVLGLLVLAGCANRSPEPMAPAPVAPATWRQVDRALLEASARATAQAEVYAQGSMEHWRTRVYQQTDESFIPWFSGYWTQEWLSLKVGWYSLNSGGDSDQAARRLALYLQEQYQQRVLAPVALEIDADQITAQAMEFYVQQLRLQLAQVSTRLQLPAAQLDQHLEGIMAIDLGPQASQRASLRQLLQVEPIVRLPAYGPLLQQLRLPEQATGTSGVPRVAQQTSEKLQAQFAGRGVAGAVAAAVGRVAGALISVGVAGVRALVQDDARPDLQAQTRRDLGEAFDQAWLRQLHDPQHGVMAGVYYLGRQLEGQLQPPAESAEVGAVP
ncbi:hypothetical protein [Pseudomonas piscis]|uniref:hypothetical protein n=1 Tax=Pseudomonas piscis TaxID=2614538 RepID=UPI001F4238E5|nr:hypothetical protein [Pseudomonas piscis]